MSTWKAWNEFNMIHEEQPCFRVEVLYHGKWKEVHTFPYNEENDAYLMASEYNPEEVRVVEDTWEVEVEDVEEFEYY